MKLISCFLFCFLKFGFLLAQVQNNSINDRIELRIDERSIHSTTAHATVEWSCIDKKLTEKCLVYHNDQWFYFIPDTTGKLFITITNQVCKNQNGVQLLVIKGDPCVRETYQLIHCLSFTDQSDTSVELLNLEPGVEYLINIDGFLADQCEFDIGISTQATGLPATRQPITDEIELQAAVVNRDVELTWYVPSSMLDSIRYFEIYKKPFRSTKFTFSANAEKVTNALGMHTQYYKHHDVVTAWGRYQYLVVGISHDMVSRVIIDQITLNVQPPAPPPIFISYTVHFVYRGEVDVQLINPTTGALLESKLLRDSQQTMVAFDVAPFVERGIKTFKVIARHRESGTTTTKVYFFDESRKAIVDL